MMEDDIEKLRRLQSFLKNESLELVQTNSYVWKLFDLKVSNVIEDRDVNYRYPFCDIFLMRKHKQRYIHIYISRTRITRISSLDMNYQPRQEEQRGLVNGILRIRLITSAGDSLLTSVSRVQEMLRHT